MAAYFISVNTSKYAFYEQGLGLDTVETVFRFSIEARDFFLQNIQIVSGAHPAFHSTGHSGPFSRNRAAGRVPQHLSPCGA